MKAGSKWVKNSLSGELEPPEIHWLIEHLLAINSKGCADAVILEHAYRIHGVWLGLRGRSDNIGYQIKGKTRLRAEPVKVSRGIKNDLTRLLAAAKSGSTKIFQKAWLAVSGKTRSLVWPPAPPIIERKFDEAGRLVSFKRERFDTSKLDSFKAQGLYSLIPAPGDAVSLIEAAISKLDEVPTSVRRARKADELADAFVGAVCSAHHALTGAVGVTWNVNEEVFEGGLVDLGRDIDAHFGMKLFTVSRMRKNISVV